MTCSRIPQQSLELEHQHTSRMMDQDRLTGLPHVGLLNRALIETGESPVLLLLNLNNLSYINSVYGIRFGDELLRGSARRLCSFSPARPEVFRSNADEFALLYHDLAEQSIAGEIERLQQHFRTEPFCIGNLSLYLSFNIGVGVGRDCYRRAIRALKWARQQGKNRVHVYSALTEALDGGRKEDYIQWNSRLHNALGSGGIRPWYQGIRDNRTGEISRWEVLARLHHDEGVASPGEFLHVAKLCGLMPSITRTLIEQALQAVSGSHHHLSLNITEEDLSLGYLPDFLDQSCARQGVSPGQLTLELLEGVSSGVKQDQAQQLSELKRRGYLLAIDDFGTEYSNFERILELEIDVLKIDAKYIRQIDRDRTSYEIVRAIAFFANNVGIRTVAEHVHCAQVQQVVEALGIDESQGYLFSVPTPDLVATPG
ncbi:bifunctional diguanylate cyclase/phosphodiesterase [Marinobacterium sp. D7]|uniref:EAL domain-containing protein n=1 Tax=Marinobacterium ramblicola TaxID=2849041 RepID=UPI001C2DA7D9|nr:bifunctional diguanylate cyclase/phosphodiesterase [Marinobacterium ramblicola]MBV1788728.1 bifunctional diguanylate cyclase/phosphodiesterase [Marinobacterium ramblicola]